MNKKAFIEAYEKTYLGELCIGRITDDGAVGLTIAGVRNQLRIPDTIVVQSVGALREYRDGRSANAAAQNGRLILSGRVGRNE